MTALSLYLDTKVFWRFVVLKFIHKIIGTVAAGALAMGMIISTSAFARDGVVNASVLNVRENPSYDADVIGSLKENTMVNAYDCDKDGWFIINHNGGYAYVASEFVTFFHPEYVMPEKIYFDDVIYGEANVDGLNVRNGATYDCTIVNTVPEGTKFIIYGEENGFFIIKDGDIERYIATQYVNAITEEEYNAQPEGSAAVVEEAYKYIGTPYVYGGSSPRGFDCSGFTSYVYRQFGVSLNRTAAGQASNGTAVSKSDLQPGDIVLFSGYSGGGIGHAGIYVGNGNMVHAPRPGYSVCVESINSSYYASRYVCARRIF